jgi:hydroxyisourate hydrolase
MARPDIDRSAAASLERRRWPDRTWQGSDPGFSRARRRTREDDAVASLSTHVLDTAAGAPAQGVRVELHRETERIAAGATDADGRIKELAAGLEPGAYRLVFHPPSPFFRRVELEVELAEGHYHVPLLVSPYGCASYRGS